MPSTKKMTTQRGGKPSRIKKGEDKMGKDCTTCDHETYCDIKKQFYDSYSIGALAFDSCNMHKPVAKPDIDLAKEQVRQLQKTLDLLNKAMGLK
jgi:hypothetical protein